MDKAAQGYVLLRKNNGPLTITSGQEKDEILAREKLDLFQEKGQMVKGLTGSSGKANGQVVLVRTKHDLRRVFAGAVMIAVTTNPDYVPAMRLCKAIVTDEGGITSHADIVFREMKIPCLVGTKSGTKVFKDGDRVGVDAEKGVVRRINDKR